MPQQETLAQRVRAKYPGAYDDLNDQQLEAAIDRKYPGVYVDILRSSQAQMPAAATAGMLPSSEVGKPRPKTRQELIEEAKSFVRKPMGEAYGEPTDVLKGVGAGAMSTIIHGGDLLRRVTGQERIIEDPGVQAMMTPPQTPAGKVGFYGEQAAEFAVPLSRVTKATKGASIVKRMGAEAGASAGVAGVQSGGDPGSMTAGAALGAAVPMAGAAVGAVRRAAAGAREGGVGGAVAGAIRAVAPQDAKPMLIQALKPRAVSRRFPQSLDAALPELKAAEATIGKPIASVDDLLEATTAAKRDIYGQIQALKNNAEGFQVDLSPVADSMVGSIPKKLRLENPDAAAKLEAASAAYRRMFSLDDAEQLLKETNAELEGLYNKYPPSQRKALVSDPEWARLNAQAQAMRNALDAGLDRAVQGQGAAARELRRRYGALLDVEMESHRRANVAARQQPQSLSEQLSTARAAGDIARGAWRLMRGDLTGAADIASGVAMRDTATFLKEQQTADALIRRAFAGYTGQRTPVVAPPRRPIRGALGPGPVVTPPPPDSSFVRGVPAEYARREIAGYLPPPMPPRRAIELPGDVELPPPDPSFVRGVPAEYGAKWEPPQPATPAPQSVKPTAAGMDVESLIDEPWRFTREQYSEAFDRGMVRITTTDGRLITPKTTGYGYHVDGKHERIIEQALLDGKPVPEEVLNDYPAFTNPNGRMQRQLAIRRRQAEAAPPELPALSTPAVKTTYTRGGVRATLDRMNREQPAKAVTPAPVRTTTKKATPPAQAAREVQAEIQRVVDTKGVKSAAEVQRRVITALEEEAASVPTSRFGDVEIRPGKAYGGREFDVWVGGNPVAHVDRYGAMKAHYGTSDELVEALGGKVVQPGKYGGTADFGPIGGDVRSMTPTEMHRAALAVVRNRLHGATGRGRITVQIPGDGTFTIDRDAQAIRDVIARIKSGGTSPWAGLGDSKAAGRPTAEKVIDQAWKPTW